jgi:hypothetical protein
MKKWGSFIVDLIGYWAIGFIMSRHYGIHGWDIFYLMATFIIIQGTMKFIKEVVEY